MYFEGLKSATTMKFEQTQSGVVDLKEMRITDFPLNFKYLDAVILELNCWISQISLINC